MAPATPAPSCRRVLAAFTNASTSASVMSPCCRVTFAFQLIRFILAVSGVLPRHHARLDERRTVFHSLPSRPLPCLLTFHVPATRAGVYASLSPAALPGALSGPVRAQP